MTRQMISSGTPWEKRVGYSRAVRVDDRVYVSGTTASDQDGAVVAAGDAAGQTRYILKKIAAALNDAGADLTDVVRTRMFVTDIDRWEEIGDVHGEFFADIRPVATMVEVSRLINPGHLIEIEVEAMISRDRP